MHDKKDILWRVYLTYILIGLAMVAVLVQVIRIQVVKGADLMGFDEGESQENTTQLREIPSMRGNIKSSDGRMLATSVPEYEIRMDLKTVSDDVFSDGVDSLSWYLGNMFNENAREWERKLRKAEEEENQYFLIKRKVRFDELGKMKDFPIFELGKYKGGFIVQSKYKRNRPFGLLAARTIGYEREGVTPVGLEGAYSDELSGEYGKQVMKKVGGVWRPASDHYMKDPEDGADIWTTIDIDIQDVAESELLRQLKEQDAKHGSVVLMEVETGYIKAIANLSKDSEGNYYETYNHAVGRSTEPGSTFKLATLMALLEDGKIDIDDSVNAYGVYRFYDAKLEDSRHGGYGKISVQQAFEYSSNVISKIVNDAYASNPQQFIDRLHSFGLIKPLGLSIAGEATPSIKNVGEEGWSGISLPWMSIGYEVRLTPLQVLAFYNAVANNGKLVKPQFVKEIRKRGKVIQKNDPVVLNKQICSMQTLLKLRKCLEGVVERGTGKNLQAAHFKIAGKTGTARIAQGSGGYGSDKDVKHQASFVGYFPADNPKYTCMVVIAAPSREIYGSKVSGTVFKAIADKVFATSIQFHEKINTENAEVNDLPLVQSGISDVTYRLLAQIGIQNKLKEHVSTPYINMAVSKEKYLPYELENQNEVVPNVIGMGLNDAVYMLENKGIFVSFEGSGRVKKQSLKPNTKLQENMHIRLKLE